MKRIDSELALAWACGIVCVVLAVVAVVYSTKDDNNHRDKCKANGGHVISKTHWNTTYSGGHSHITADTDHYCLNGTGGILDIW